MSRVITFSRTFPAYHPRKGQSTFFVEKILNSIYWPKSIHDIPIEVQNIITDLVLFDRDVKYHTIRAGNRWKEGDCFSPRVWSGKPYKTKQIIIAPDIKIEKVWSFEITPTGAECCIFIDSFSKPFSLLDSIARNDGLTRDDFNHWFSTKQIRNNGFKGQIICWNKNIKY